MSAQPQQRSVRHIPRQPQPEPQRQSFAAEIIVLAQMAKLRADPAGNFPIIVYDEADAGLMENGLDFFNEMPDLVLRRALGRS